MNHNTRQKKKKKNINGIVILAIKSCLSIPSSSSLALVYLPPDWMMFGPKEVEDSAAYTKKVTSSNKKKKKKLIISSNGIKVMHDEAKIERRQEDAPFWLNANLSPWSKIFFYFILANGSWSSTWSYTDNLSSCQKLSIIAESRARTRQLNNRPCCRPSRIISVKVRFIATVG